MISIANHKSLIRLRSGLLAYGAALVAAGLAQIRARLPRRADRSNPLLQFASKPMHFNAISFPLRSSQRRFPGYSGLFRAIPATLKLSCGDLANQPRSRPIRPFIHRVNQTKSDKIKPLTFFQDATLPPSVPRLRDCAKRFGLGAFSGVSGLVPGIPPIRQILQAITNQARATFRKSAFIRVHLRFIPKKIKPN
jgi:hypothetical protein